MRQRSKYHLSKNAINGICFLLGFGAIAAVPVSEIQAPRAKTSDLDQEFLNLNQVEGRYSESWQQQQRLKSGLVGKASSPKPQTVKKRR